MTTEPPRNYRSDPLTGDDVPTYSKRQVASLRAALAAAEARAETAEAELREVRDQLAAAIAEHTECLENGLSTGECDDCGYPWHRSRGGCTAREHLIRFRDALSPPSTVTLNATQPGVDEHSDSRNATPASAQPDDLADLIEQAKRERPGFSAAYEDAKRRHTVLDALFNARKASGLTQKQVAELMGVKQPIVYEFECESSDPRLSTLQRYARAIGGEVVVRFESSPVTPEPAEPEQKDGDWRVGDVVRLERTDGTLPYDRIAVMTDGDPRGDRAAWWLFPARDEARPYRLTSFIEAEGPLLIYRRPVAGVSTDGAAPVVRKEPEA